jgi:hypothetical protein
MHKRVLGRRNWIGGPRTALLVIFGLLGWVALLGAAEPTDRPKLFAYDLFFRHVGESQSAVAQTALTFNRADFQNTYDLSDAVFAELVRTATAYTAAVATIDAKAAAIVTSAKARYRVSGTAKGPSVPAAPPELQDLQQQKEDLIRTTLSSLTGSLGSAQFAYLTYLLMQHVSVQPAPAGTPQ